MKVPKVAFNWRGGGTVEIDPSIIVDGLSDDATDEQIGDAIRADAATGIDACGFSADLSIYVAADHVAAVRAALEARKAAP